MTSYSPLIYTIEPLTECQKKCIESALGRGVCYIPREEFDSLGIYDGLEILICRDRDNISEIVNLCPNLKLLFVISAGVEKLPFELLRYKKIKVAHAKGVNANVISQYVMAYILSFASNVFENMTNQTNHYWKPYQTVEPLNSKILLVIGTGNIGKMVAKHAKNFGMTVLGIRREMKEPLAEFDNIDDFTHIENYIQVADYIVIACPLTKETNLLLHSQRIRMLKRGSVIINVARAGICDYKAIAEQCAEGQISAVLDVHSTEPLQENDNFWNTPNMIITPHAAGRMPHYIDHVIPQLISNIEAFLRGESMTDEVDLGKEY